MSGFELREGDGSLFKNEHRENDRQPSHRGSIRIGGVLYLLSAWERVGRSGRHWTSLRAELPKSRAETAPLPDPNPGKPRGAAVDDPDFAAPLEF